MELNAEDGPRKKSRLDGTCHQCLVTTLREPPRRTGRDNQRPYILRIHQDDLTWKGTVCNQGSGKNNDHATYTNQEKDHTQVTLKSGNMCHIETNQQAPKAPQQMTETESNRAAASRSHQATYLDLLGDLAAKQKLLSLSIVPIQGPLFHVARSSRKTTGGWRGTNQSEAAEAPLLLASKPRIWFLAQRRPTIRFDNCTL
ncbi:hypothetical protein V8F20_005539 [Naviculisporaceae sp. PSN 640]